MVREISRIRRWLAVLVIWFGCAVMATAKEEITAFDAQIAVTAQGAITVTETITVNSESDQIRHGIYRDFPRYFTGPNGARGEVAFDVVSVLRDGALEEWTSETISGGTRLRIGDADFVLPAGKYVYQITYGTDRQIRFEDGFDRLVWNVTGNGWQFPIVQATATVTLPEGVAPLTALPFTGLAGETKTDATAEIQGNTARFVTTRPLALAEGLTIEVRFPKDTILAGDPGQTRAWWWRDHLGSVLAWGGFAVVFGYFMMMWHKVGRDPARGVIVPRWDLSGDVSPALVDYISASGLSKGGRTAFAASAVDLAVKGYLILDDRDDKLTLRRTEKTAEESLPGGQAALLESIEEAGGRFTFTPAKSDAIDAMMTAFRIAVHDENQGRYFVANKGWFFLGLLLSAFVALVWGLSNGWVADDTMILAVSSAVPFGVNLLGWGAFRARQKRVGAARVFMGAVIVFIAVIGVIAWAVVWFGWSRELGASAALPALAISWGLVSLNQIFFVLIRAATPYGRVVKDEIAGLNLYLTLAEAPRMNLAGAPRMSPAHFETLLPYAMVLGVEKPWRKGFDAWLRLPVAASDYTPQWYTGRADNAPLGISKFASSLVSATHTSSDSDSSSGGSSSSGSGGGGGGGGGW